jgi:hypothetical protein
LLLSRAHPLRTVAEVSSGGSLRIQNVQLAEQYAKILSFWKFRVAGSESLDPAQRLQLSYYLLLQERVDEAERWFDSGVKLLMEDSNPTRVICPDLEVAMDYLRCYFALYSDTPETALPIAERYVSAHPLLRDRLMFQEVIRQLRELQELNNEEPTKVGAVSSSEFPSDSCESAPGAEPPCEPLPRSSDLSQDPVARDRAMSALASSDPSLDFNFISPTSIRIQAHAVPAVQVSFYMVDLELLFSTYPFLMDDFTGARPPGGSLTPSKEASRMITDSLRLVAPTFSMSVVRLPTPAADGSQRAFDLQLPIEHIHSNCWVEVSAVSIPESEDESISPHVAAVPSALSVFRPHFSTSLNVVLSAAAGEVQVRHSSTGRPLVGTYVKVYTRDNHGGVAFFKDGYVDRRGRFQYAALSSNQLVSAALLRGFM